MRIKSQESKELKKKHIEACLEVVYCYASKPLFITASKLDFFFLNTYLS